MSWKIKAVDEITELVTKGTTPSTYGYEFTDDGVNYIRAEGISKDGYVDESTFLKISEECNQKLSRSQLKKNDILFSIAGMALGKTGIVKEDYLPANTNQAVAIIRPNVQIVYSKFLQYYFVNPEFYKLVNSVSAQSAQPNINLSQIKSLKINLPPLQTQKRIASILSSYDDLIENNLKRIKLLEETAQNIYKDWFVNFRFPNYENTPFNEETGLPEGWEKVIFSDLYSLNNGCAFKSEDYKNDGVPILRTRDYSNSFFINMNDPIYISNDLLPTFSKYLVEELDFLIIMVGASIGKYGVVLKKDLPSLLNQNQWAIRTLYDFSEYSFYKLFSLQDVMRELLMKRTGAARDFFRAAFLKEIKVIKPNREIILEFNKEIEPIMNLISSLLSQNQKLKEARDILLPRLMNRTIEV